MSGGCLLVGEWPVVWPHGTTWDAQGRTVHLADGEVVRLVDEVSGGGGYLHLPDLPPDLADPLADCPTDEHDEVAVFNAGEPVTVTR